MTIICWHIQTKYFKSASSVTFCMLLPIVTLPDKHLQSEGSAVFESRLCTSEVKAQLSVELQTWAKVA